MQRESVSFPSNSNKVQAETGTAAAENQLYYIYPVLFALILPAIIGISRLTPVVLYEVIFYDFLKFIPVALIIKIGFDWADKNESFVIFQFRYLSPLKYLENLPASIVFKTQHKKIKLPWITLILIICNTIIYYFVPEDVSRRFVFTPYRYWSLPGVLISVFTSAFLHGSESHLFGNMLFLVIFGSAVESKIGSTRFLAVYFLCQITSILMDVVLLKFSYPDTCLWLGLKDFHTRGSSGAISGIMGLFVVRCLFTRVVLNGPFFSVPFLSIPTGIIGTLLSSNFFAFDVQGSLDMFQSENNIDYWAHLGGYLGGFALGYCLKLHKEASKEAHSVKSRMMIHKHAIKKGGRLHVAALRFLLDHYKQDTKKSELYFVRLVQALINTNFKNAIEIFTAYYPKYVDSLSGDILLDIGLHFYRAADLEKARKCWESAARKTGPWQGKAKLYLTRPMLRNEGGIPIYKKKFI